jgi:ABC-type lipoprotein export system ATPase subunit
MAGEMVAILGPSGSGKSTLMNMIGCLDVPTSGEYYFAGREISQLSSDELAALRSEDISFIFQSFHLLSGKTVFQNVMLPLLYQQSFSGNKTEAVKDALRAAQLEESQCSSRVGNVSVSLLRAHSQLVHVCFWQMSQRVTWIQKQVLMLLKN